MGGGRTQPQIWRPAPPQRLSNVNSGAPKEMGLVLISHPGLTVQRSAIS